MGSDGATSRVFEQQTDEETGRILERADALARDTDCESSREEALADDLEMDEDEAVSGGGGRSAGDSKKGRQYFNVVAVNGAPLPSDSAKFSGNSPKMAATKAARRIWKKSGATEFDVLMRKVSQTANKRTLYKYKADVSELSEPGAFFTANAPKFESKTGETVSDKKKRVKIVRSSDDPVYGQVGGDGSIVQGGAGSSEGTLHRARNTDTLTLSIGPDAPLPDKVAGLRVLRNDHLVATQRVNPTEEEMEKLDVAGAAKRHAKEAERAAKLKRKEKAATAKRREAETRKKEKDAQKARAKSERASSSSKTAAKTSSNTAAKTASTGASGSASGSSESGERPTQSASTKRALERSRARTTVRGNRGAPLTFSKH